MTIILSFKTLVCIAMLGSVIKTRKGDFWSVKINKYKGIIPAFYACYDDEGNIVQNELAYQTLWLWAS